MSKANCTFLSVSLDWLLLYTAPHLDVKTFKCTSSHVVRSYFFFREVAKGENIWILTHNIVIDHKLTASLLLSSDLLFMDMIQCQWNSPMFKKLKPNNCITIHFRADT